MRVTDASLINRLPVQVRVTLSPTAGPGKRLRVGSGLIVQVRPATVTLVLETSVIAPVTVVVSPGGGPRR
jgi:hypothetical protein